MAARWSVLSCATVALLVPMAVALRAPAGLHEMTTTRVSAASSNARPARPLAAQATADDGPFPEFADDTPQQGLPKKKKLVPAPATPDYGRTLAVSAALSLSLLAAATTGPLAPLAQRTAPVAVRDVEGKTKWDRREARVRLALLDEASSSSKGATVVGQPKMAPPDLAASLAAMRSKVVAPEAGDDAPGDGSVVKLGVAIGAFPFVALPALLAAKVLSIFNRIRAKAKILRKV